MVGTTLNKVEYTISSSSSNPLPIPFRYDEDSWIYVVSFASESTTTQNLVLGEDYTLSGDGVSSQGELTLDASFLSGLPANTRLVIYRIAPALQTLDLQYNTRLPSEALEKTLDTLAMASIDRGSMTESSWKFPLSDPEDFQSSYTVPNSNERKTKQFPMFRSGDGMPVYATAQELANVILAYFGDAPTAADVLAAIAALAPLIRQSAPTSSTEALPGQWAIVRSALIQNYSEASPWSDSDFNSLIGLALIEAPPVVGPAWTTDGLPVTSPGTRIAIMLSYIASEGEVRWSVVGIKNGLINFGFYADQDVTSPELVTSWTAESAAEGEFSVKMDYRQLWVNFSDTSLPNWGRMIGYNDLLNLPSSDPGVPGALFLSDTTVLNVSQG